VIEGDVWRAARWLDLVDLRERDAEVGPVDEVMGGGIDTSLRGATSSPSDSDVEQNTDSGSSGVL